MRRAVELGGRCPYGQGAKVVRWPGVSARRAAVSQSPLNTEQGGWAS
jgi:hypothetical protein